MWNLQENTCAITSLVAGLSTTMLHVLKNTQSIVNQFMALVSVDIHHHADTTRIVLILGTIQSISHINIFLNSNDFLSS